MKKLLFILAVFFIVPNVSQAAILHRYTCADGLTPAGASPTCVGTDVFTFGGGAASMNDSAPLFSTSDGSTVYITLSTTGGSSPYYALIFAGSMGNSFYNITGNVSETAHTISGLGGSGAMTSFLIRDDNAGTIYDLCIDDDGTSCTSAPIPESGNDYGQNIFFVASTTASTTLSIVDNPTQDLFNGLLLFFIVLWGTVWFFKH